MLDVETKLGDAVNHFWRVRAHQQKWQGSKTGVKDAGKRGSVTGGKHADGFINLIAAIVHDSGLPNASIHVSEKNRRTLPGFFRPTKEWDLVVTSGSNLVAAVEVKSQVGSFGNNFNNRVEEALGNATDFWAACKQGIFNPSQKPWLGYIFMLEESPDSLRPKRRIQLSPYSVDNEFQEQSYARNYRRSVPPFGAGTHLRFSLLLHVQRQVRKAWRVQAAQRRTEHQELRHLASCPCRGVCEDQVVQ